MSTSITCYNLDNTSLNLSLILSEISESTLGDGSLYDSGSWFQIPPPISWGRRSTTFPYELIRSPAFVEVKLVSQDKIDGEYPVCAIFTRKIFSLRRSHPFGPFDLQRFKDSNLCPNGFTLCLTCWEEKNESIETEATGIWKRRPHFYCDSLLLDA